MLIARIFIADRLIRHYLSSMSVLDQWMRKYSRPELTLVRSAVVGRWGFRLDPGATVAFHLVKQGSGWLRRDGVPDVRLAEGDLVVIANGEAHDLIDRQGGFAEPVAEFAQRTFDLSGRAPDAVIFCGTLRADTARRQTGVFAIPPFIHLSGAEIADDPGIASLVSLLSAELECTSEGNETLIESLTSGLMIYVLRRAAELAGHSPGWLVAMNDPQLARVFQAIHATPAEAWTVEAMADSAGLSRATFSRRFTDRVGEPPLSYLTAWRMTLAGRRLLQGKQPLSRIAAEVGYSSEAAFSRAFKRHHGVAPAGYRNGGVGV